MGSLALAPQPSVEDSHLLPVMILPHSFAETEVDVNSGHNDFS
jgi:hypothetical protein